MAAQRQNGRRVLGKKKFRSDCTGSRRDLLAAAVVVVVRVDIFFSLSENDNKVARGARGCAFCIITINFIIIAVKYAASDWPVH